MTDSVAVSPSSSTFPAAQHLLALAAQHEVLLEQDLHRLLIAAGGDDDLVAGQGGVDGVLDGAEVRRHVQAVGARGAGQERDDHGRQERASHGKDTVPKSLSA